MSRMSGSHFRWNPNLRKAGRILFQLDLLADKNNYRLRVCHTYWVRVLEQEGRLPTASQMSKALEQNQPGNYAPCVRQSCKLPFRLRWLAWKWQLARNCCERHQMLCGQTTYSHSHMYTPWRDSHASVNLLLANKYSTFQSISFTVNTWRFKVVKMSKHQWYQRRIAICPRLPRHMKHIVLSAHRVH